MVFEPGAAKPQCPKCGGLEVVYDPQRGELICKKCGTVIRTDNIDLQSETRAFDVTEFQLARSGAPYSPTHFETQFSTILAPEEASRENRALVSRLVRLQRHSTLYSPIERNIQQAYEKLKEIKHRLDLPEQIAETAMEIYREAAQHRFTRGKHIVPMLIATIYLACRKHNMARPYEEIIKALDKEKDSIFKKQVTKSIRLLQQRLKLGIGYATAKNYIPLVAERLRLPAPVRATALDLIEKAEKKGISYGKDPAGLAAAALYIAAVIHQMRKTQQEVARAAHITEVTIRNRYKEFVRELNLEVPAELEE
ncbi:MAG: TFIIB-type zinc ribbon-containing protein [Candidatus Korarchaeota archaeon]